MKCAISVSNFKCLKDVNIAPEGLTLITGSNSSGKSSVFAALVALLSETHSPSYERHNGGGYSIVVSLDGVTAAYDRKTKRTVRDTAFGLQQHNAAGVKFYPNFAFQCEVPLFDSISVYDLFSLMFADVAQLSVCLSDAHLAEKQAERVLSMALARFEINREMYEKAKIALDDFNSKNPTLDEDYLAACELRQRISVYQEAVADYTAAAEAAPDLTLRAWAAEYEQALPLIARYEFVLAVQQKLEQKKKHEYELAAALAEVADIPPESDLDIVARCSQQELRAAPLETMKQTLAALPTASSLSLIERVLSLIPRQETLKNCKTVLSVIPSERMFIVIEMISKLSEARERLSSYDREAGLVASQLYKLLKRLEATGYSCLESCPFIS